MKNESCICLVDDDVILLKALAGGLRDLGHAVWTAPGAAAALDLMTRETVDVIVTDMKMPGTSGSQFIAQVRSNRPHLPIVAMSGEASVDGGRSLVNAVRAVGASELLLKPFRASQLSAMVGRLLAERPSP